MSVGDDASPLVAPFSHRNPELTSQCTICGPSLLAPNPLAANERVRSAFDQTPRGASTHVSCFLLFWASALLGGGKVLHPDVALCVQFLELFGASNGHHLLAPTMLSTSIRSGDSALPIPQRLEGDRLVFYGQLLPSFNKSTVAEEGLRPSPLLRP
jgi:hypothetical protein